VINEICNVLKRNKYSEPEIRRIADDIIGLCEIFDYSVEAIILASNLRERYSFSFWDSQIIASALLSGCGVLASEDMQDGFIIENLKIINIFESN